MSTKKVSISLYDTKTKSVSFDSSNEPYIISFSSILDIFRISKWRERFGFGWNINDFHSSDYLDWREQKHRFVLWIFSWGWIFFILSIILFWIVYIGIYKVRHSFWSRQPVFHPHHIQLRLGMKEWIPSFKFTFPKEVNLKFHEPNHCYVFPMKEGWIHGEKTKQEKGNKKGNENGNITQQNIISFIEFKEFLSKNFLRDEIHDYYPEMKYLKSYFLHHNVNQYIEPYMGIYLSNGRQENGSTILSTITSRPMLVQYVSRENIPYQWVSHYVDFLCTSKEVRRVGITPKLIYTFAKQTASFSPHITSWLFKVEGYHTLPFMPCIKAKCAVFDVQMWSEMPYKMNSKLERMDDNNIRMFSQVESILSSCSQYKDEFKMVVRPSKSNLLNLVQQGTYYVFAYGTSHSKEGVYIFENTGVKREGGNVIQLVAVLSTALCGEKAKSTHSNERQLFCNHWMNSIVYMKNHPDIKMRYLIMPNTSHTSVLYGWLYALGTQLFVPIQTYDIHYYWYNMAMRRIRPDKCLILF